MSRRWLVAGGIGIATLLLVVLGFGVIYPRVGAWMIRKRLDDRLAQRLGRNVKVGDIDVSFGHAVVHDLEIRGPLDGEMPLVHVDQVDLEFDGWSSLVGSLHLGPARVDGVIVTLRRDAQGRDNLSDVIDRLHSGQGGTSSGPSKRPTSITVRRAKLLADDQLTGATLAIDDGDATWTPDGLVAHARGVMATTINAPKATLASLELRKLSGASPIISLEGGEIQLWTKMALSGIGGKIVADPDHPERYIIDLAGGYGGVPGQLWTARGGLDPRAATASLDLEAAKFQLDRLAPILEHTPVVDYHTSAIDTHVHIDADRAGAKFAGSFHLSGLNLGDPRIAEKEVHDLDLSGQIAGTFDRAQRKLDLTRGDFLARGVPFSVTGSVMSPHPGAPVAEGETPPGRQLSLRLLVPTIDCQRFLTSIPPEMVPYMQGYRLKGLFDLDLHVAIDWANLDALDLGGHVGNHCRVVDEPEDSPKRLKDEFEHYVEVEQGEWMSFVVGPTNPDFVPIDQISPYLVKSIMSTEDSAFYQHHGFITSEFRTALVNDLKAGKFQQGASSITMQMVKNVLLYREKTLMRKLQELFLTWHVENTLEKDRIMEIYLNVIEYGPGLYGIGPAARQYFGKAAKDLNPREAAFFSSILPNPKARYAQYCQGTLTKWTEAKIERILQTMLKRDRLTQEEYDQAMATPLLFVKDGSETEDECMKRVKKALKNARPTDPLKALEQAAHDKSDKKHRKKPGSRR